MPGTKPGAAIVSGCHRRTGAQHSPACAVDELDLFIQGHLVNH